MRGRCRSRSRIYAGILSKRKFPDEKAFLGSHIPRHDSKRIFQFVILPQKNISHSRCFPRLVFSLGK